PFFQKCRGIDHDRIENSPSELALLQVEIVEMPAQASLVGFTQFRFLVFQFGVARMVFSHPRESALHANAFASFGIARIVQKIGINEPWPIIVITGKNGIEKRLLVREWHGES